MLPMIKRALLRIPAVLDDFLTRAVIAGIGVALVAAPLGCFVVWQRLSYFGSTLAHSGLLGIALGLMLGIDLTLGVIITCVVIALMLLGLETRSRLPADTILGILAHVTLAAGMVGAASLPGARLDLTGYLFGDLLAVSQTDLLWIYAGGAAVLGLIAWHWRGMIAVSVNPELAEAEGVPVARLRVVLMLLLAFTIAVAMKIVGILLITSLLILPAAAARPFARTPEAMAGLAAIIAAAGVVLGLGASLSYDWPAGPAIVLGLAVLFCATLAWSIMTQRHAAAAPRG